MKNLRVFFLATAMSIFFISCNQNSANGEKQETTSADESQPSTAQNNDGAIISSILNDYLNIKNALVESNSIKAAEFGKNLLTTLKSMDMSSIPSDKHEKYMDITEDIEEHTEHISKNAEKLEHQRSHFSSLSEDILELINLMGSNQKLYQDYCPMYDNNEGAMWISETKDIKNPYFGDKMMTCGTIQKEFN